jgi:hypothetical protein
MEQKLYMCMLGCTPEGRLTEQHDIFFGTGNSLSETVPAMKTFWPEAKGLHVDAWREVRSVDGYSVTLTGPFEVSESDPKLYFINLGGYVPGVFDEQHYKMLLVATSMSEALRAAKRTAFYKENGFKGAPSHIDEKYGFDVDDIMEVGKLPHLKNVGLRLLPAEGLPDDKIHLGYLPPGKILKGSM